MTEIGYVTAPLAGWNTFIDEAEADPEFQWPKSVPLVDRMRRDDPQIASVLLAVTLPLLESDWQLDCTGVRPEVARHVSQDLGIEIKGTVWEAPLRTKGRFTWNEHLPLALLELAFGHSVFEQVYEPDAFGRAHLKKLAWRPPRTIASFDVARDGGLVAVRQFGVVELSGDDFGSPNCRTSLVTDVEPAAVGHSVADVARELEQRGRPEEVVFFEALSDAQRDHTGPQLHQLESTPADFGLRALVGYRRRLGETVATDGEGGDDVAGLRAHFPEHRVAHLRNAEEETTGKAHLMLIAETLEANSQVGGGHEGSGASRCVTGLT